MPTAGGEARRLTCKLKGVDGVAWSPDSSQIAFTARVRPADEPSILNSPDPPPLRDIRRIRHRFDGAGLLDGRTHLFVVGLDGGEPRQITDGDWDDGAPAWSPDGTSIAFASNRAADRDWEDRTDIYVVPATGGRAKKLTRVAPRPRVAGLVAGRPDDRLPRPDRRRAGRRERPDLDRSRPPAATRPASPPTWTSRSAATS